MERSRCPLPLNYALHTTSAPVRLLELKSVYYVEFDYDGVTREGELTPMRQNETKTMQYLLTDVHLTLDAGAGNDTIVGSQRADTLIGGSGNDVFFAGTGDSVAGGEGDDYLIPDDPTDAGINIRIGIGVEQVFGAGGNDRFDATAATAQGIASKDARRQVIGHLRRRTTKFTCRGRSWDVEP